MIKKIITNIFFTGVIKGGPLRSTFTDQVFENRVKEWFRQARTRLNAIKIKHWWQQQLRCLMKKTVLNFIMFLSSL